MEDLSLKGQEWKDGIEGGATGCEGGENTVERGFRQGQTRPGTQRPLVGRIPNPSVCVGRISNPSVWAGRIGNPSGAQGQVENPSVWAGRIGNPSYKK